MYERRRCLYTTFLFAVDRRPTSTLFIASSFFKDIRTHVYTHVDDDSLKLNVQVTSVVTNDREKRESVIQMVSKCASVGREESYYQGRFNDFFQGHRHFTRINVYLFIVRRCCSMNYDTMTLGRP